MKKIVFLFLVLLFFDCNSVKNSSKLIPIISTRSRSEVPHINPRFNSGKIKPINYEIVDSIAVRMKNFPTVKFELEAHSDNIEIKNDSTIGKKRLAVIKKLLIQKGIKAENLFTIDYKDEYPIDTNETEVGRAFNRRVEIKIKK